MPIKFSCPKCKKELTVKDEMAGKQGKCPGCKGAITVPSAASVTAQAAPLPKKKSVEEDDEVVAAEVVDDDVVAAEVVDDEEDAPVKKRKSRRDEEDYDDEDDEDGRRRSRAKKSSRRDDEDDYDDDDRPSRRKKSRSRRRDDDDDDDDNRPKKISSATRSARFRRARIGMFLNVIGHFVYAGVFAVGMIAAIIITIMAASKSGRGSDGGFIKVFSYLTCLPLVVAMISNVVGSAFIVLTPGKRGELGLGIATVSTSGVSAFMTLFLVIQFLSDPYFGGLLAWMIPFLILNPFSGLLGTQTIMIGGVTFLLILLPLVEIGRMVCLSLYMWAVGKSQRDKDVEKTGFLFVILIPSVCAGTGLLVWVLSLATTRQPSIFSIVMGVNGLILGGMLIWYAKGLSLISGTLEDAE